MFGNLFSGMFNGNMLANVGKSDPWAGMRQVGSHPLTMQDRAKSVFGNMAGMQPEQPQTQFSPVQFGGARQGGNDLSKLVMALMQRGQ